MNGVLSEWSEFYSCDVTCGGGIQWRYRTCIGPFFGGDECTEPLEESQECNTLLCPSKYLCFLQLTVCTFQMYISLPHLNLEFLFICLCFNQKLMYLNILKHIPYQESLPQGSQVLHTL